MKRLIALVLSLVMALSLCAPAWGAEAEVAPEAPAATTLPEGVTAESFGANTVTDGTNYYETLQTAVEAIATAKTSGATLYCKPSADVGSLQHAPVCSTLTIYGNGATVAAGGERDFDIGNTDPSGGKDVTADMTLTVYDLDGCGAWGAKATEHTVNLVFNGCMNMGKVFLTGTAGTLNITMSDCSFEGVISEALYSNANGKIELTRVAFSHLNKAINLNHKVAGTQTVTLTDCSFTNCGKDVSSDQIPVRVLSSVKDGVSSLTVSGCTFSGTPEGGADILLDYGVGTTTASVSGTAANVAVEYESNVATKKAVAATENVDLKNYKAVAEVGGVEFFTLQAAFDAVKGGETITLLDSVSIAQAGATNNNAVYYTGDKSFTIDFNGKTVTGDTSNVVFRFQKTEGGAENTITFKNGKIVSTANSWSAVSVGSDAETKTHVNLTGMTLEANKGGDFAVRARTNCVMTLTDCDVNTKYAGGVVASGGEVTLNNVTVDQQGMHSAPYNSVAVSANGKGKVTINDGSYSTKILAVSDGNNQGASHGSWCLGIMNSGGTMIINGGTFSNGVHESTTANTNYRALVDTDDYANLQINGGTFTAIKDIISNSSIADGSPADGAAAITIAGGTYSKAPGADYIAEGYICAPTSGADTYTVQKKVTTENTNATTATNTAVSSGTVVEAVKEATGTTVTVAETTIELTDAGKDAFKAAIDENEADSTKPLEIETEIAISDVSETLATAVQDEMEAKLKGVAGDAAKIAAVLDIDIHVFVNDQHVGQLTELPQPITITLDLPEIEEELKDGYRRSYFVIIHHDSEAKEIPATVSGDKLIITSDRFSPYALGYVDTEIPTGGGYYPYYPPTTTPDDDTVKSAETFDAGVTLYVAVSIIGAVGTVALGKKRED